MWSRRRRFALLLVGALILLLIGGRVITEVWVQLLWFRSIELERVFWTRWGAATAVRLSVGLLVALFVFANLWVVSRSLGSIRVRRRYGNIEIAERLPQAYVVGAIALISLFSGWWLSAAVVDPLGTLAAFRHTAWGSVDPVFGRDLSFYVFVLPLLGSAQTLIGVLLVWTALLAVAAYVATGSIRVQDGNPSVTPAVETHLGLLLAGFVLVLAWDAWLDRYGLLLDGNGIGGAYGYTDAHARLPGLTLFAAAGVLAAGAIAYGAWTQRRRLPAAALLAVVLVGVGGKLVYPSIVQRFSVEPNQLPRELPYIAHHLRATLDAYRLGDLAPVPLPYRSRGELRDTDRLRSVLSGVPLWDPRPLAVAFDQKQSLFPYYDFLSVHLDRYGPEDRPEQVAIAVRELTPSELPPSAQTWQNLHLRYVSGQGAVVSPVARMAEDGAPVYYVADLNPPKLAPDAPPELALTEPNVYFGERSHGYVILDDEVGPRGVPLDGFLRRLGFAWAFQSKNLLISGEVRPGSRIVFGRSALERARAVAPFLYFTSDSPYPVIHEGRVVWLVDGYSTSTSYPLSPRSNYAGQVVRYVRNSVKVLVDGLTGEVAVYAVDPDPILETYGRIFPGLVRPVEELPGELRRHLRFPRSLMSLQAELLGEYHLSDPRAFYEKEDVWAVATENYRNETVAAQPTFTILPLPGETDPEFLLMLPFVSRGRQNMTALFVVRNDPPHYGEQILYLFPRDELVPGPQQVEAMIDQDPEIAQQLSLWRRGGSEVIRGHLVVVPVDSTLVYAEPLYLEAQNAAIPQLERVILAHEGRVAMRPSLSGALAALTGAAEDAEEQPGGVEAEPAGADPRAAALSRAGRLLEQAEERLRAGDWAGFGRAWQSLREALREASGGGDPGI